MPREVLTVGHSTHELQAFVELLARHDVRALVDVRRYPGSRRLPHFNAASLDDALGAAGIAYLGLGDELGGRRKPRPDSANDGWRVDAFRGYADHLASPDFAAGLARLEEEAMQRRTAYMCAEGDWRRCHRRLISDVLVARGWQVSHIARDGSSETHELTAFAVVGSKRAAPPPQAISYPAAQPRLGS